jgi:putative hydrolase of the HAD superfamily
MIKAVLFDLGGTLLHYHGADEKTLYLQGMRELHRELTRRGHALPHFDAFHKRIYRAIRVRAALLFFSQRELKVGKILQRILGRMHVRLKEWEAEELPQVWWKVSQPHVGFYDDVAETLQRLDDMGLKIGLISNTLWPAWVLKEELRRRGHSRHFDLMLFSPEVGFRKPSRKIFRRALKELELKGREAAFVGDCLVEDVRGPQRVKMLTILKRHPRQRLRRSIKPDFVVDKLSEIPDIIRKVNAAQRKR